MSTSEENPLRRKSTVPFRKMSTLKRDSAVLPNYGPPSHRRESSQVSQIGDLLSGYEKRASTIKEESVDSALLAHNGVNSVSCSRKQIWSIIEQAIEKYNINLAKNVMKVEDMVNIIEMMGLKMTHLQLTEAILVSCENTKDLSKFKFDNYVGWLQKTIPLLHTRTSGFRLPRQSASLSKALFLNKQPIRPRNKFSIQLDELDIAHMSNVTFDNGPSRKVQTLAPSPLRSKSVQRRALDLSCGDPFFHIKNEQRDYLKENARKSPELEGRILGAFQQITKFPALKRQLQSDLQNYKNQRIEDSGLTGMKGSNRSKWYLKEAQALEKENEQRLLNQILVTEPSACRANNLNELLKKKWSESGPGVTRRFTTTQTLPYVIRSRLSPKDEERVRELTNSNRYS